MKVNISKRAKADADPKLKRLLLGKSRCHIHFEIDDKKQMIKVLTVRAFAEAVSTFLF